MLSKFTSVKVDFEILQTDLKNKRQERKVLSERYQKASEDFKDYNGLLRWLKSNDLSHQFALIKQEVKSKTDQIGEIESKSDATLRANLDRLIERLSKREKIVIAHEVKLLDVEEDVEVYSGLITAIEALKEGVFNGFMIELVEQINKKFETVSDSDFYCVLESNKGALRMLFDNNQEGSKLKHYDVFSLGERSRINRAVTDALNEMLDLPFIVEDETLHGADIAGEERIMDSIRKTNVGCTLIFISNRIESKSFYDSCKSITVTKRRMGNKIQSEVSIV